MTTLLDLDLNVTTLVYLEKNLTTISSLLTQEVTVVLPSQIVTATPQIVTAASKNVTAAGNVRAYLEIMHLSVNP